MKGLLMNKGLKIGCKIAGTVLLAGASVMGAAQADEAVQEMLKVVAAKVVKKTVEA